jgi:hypothetical protein
MFRVGNNNADFTIYPSSTSPAIQASMEAPQSSVMYLDKEVAGGAASVLGFFSLDSAGDLTFTVESAAVPEPATWMTGILIASTLILAAARRRIGAPKAA